MINVHIFTFNRDFLITKTGVEGVVATVKPASVTVWDDGNNPMSPVQADEIAAAGGIYRVTRWDRRGNLNGPGAVRGIIDCLRSVGGADDVAVKLDADTVWRSDGIIKRMTDGGAGGFGSAFKGRAFSGCCYGFKVGSLNRIAAVAERTSIDQNAPEDETIFRLAGGVGVKIHTELAWGAGALGSKWTAWNWPADPPIEAYRQFEMVTMGTAVRFNQGWVDRMPEIMKALYGQVLI